MKQIFATLAALALSGRIGMADTVVAPYDRATQEGSHFVISGFQNPARFQTVYGSRNFSGPMLIRGLAFRLDAASGNSSVQTDIPRLTIRLSTYGGSFETFNRGDYVLNKGPDDVSVFDGGVRWVTTDLGTAPNPFDLRLQFSQPFLYDPAKGSLLMGFDDASQSFSGGIIADAHVHFDSTIGWIANPNGVELGNLVTQFDFTSIPEPATAALLTVGVLVLAMIRRISKRGYRNESGIAIVFTLKWRVRRIGASSDIRVLRLH